MQEVNEARARSQPGLWQDGGEVRQEAGRGACREVLVLSWVHVHVESGEWRAGNVGSAAQAGAAQAQEPGSWVSPLGDRRLLVFQRTGAVTLSHERTGSNTERLIHPPITASPYRCHGHRPHNLTE